VEVVLERCVDLSATLSRRVANVVVTLGKHGVLLARRANVGSPLPTKRLTPVNVHSPVQVSVSVLTFKVFPPLNLRNPQPTDDYGLE